MENHKHTRKFKTMAVQNMMKFKTLQRFIFISKHIFTMGNIFFWSEPLRISAFLDLIMEKCCWRYPFVNVRRW